MKVSRVVLIVVALHVLVIGGIFVFEGCSRSQAPTPDMAANESQPGEQPAAMAPSAPSAQAVAPVTPQVLTPAVPASIPAPVTAAAAPQPTTARTYVVKKGDSLWKIAKLEGISMGELTRANNLTKTSALKIGQKLQIPQSVKAGAVTTAMASVIPSSTDATAVAPASDATGPMYTVKSGDSLWKIARQQSVSVAAIKQANNLSSDALKIGQKLHIPAASATASASAASTTASPSVNGGIATPSHATDWREPGQYTENGQTIHIVDFNESPSTIAKKYGIKTEELMRANNITSATKVQYGQRLVIPLSQPTAQPQTQTAPVSATPVVSSGGIQPALAAPVVSASRATIQ
jgi:LysM repeat protein